MLVVFAVLFQNDREGVIRDVRAKRYFVKPAQAKRRKKKELDFNNMLRVRYSNM